MIRQAPETQTLFAELSERLRALEASRSFASLPGSFAKKSVGDKTYWYFKTSAGVTGQREYFVGPDDAQTRGVIATYGAARSEAESARDQVDRLCAMLRHGGALMTDAPTARVVAGLGSAGVFHLGAMLVGANAFVVIGNVLGVRWESTLRTQDIDLAAERVLHVAVPQVETDLPKALDSLHMGFLPVPGLDPREPATSFKVRGQPLRVDLLTPARNARDDRPVRIARLNAAAQPLEILDYVLEAAIPAPMVNGGATLVNVPDPARFALHKLIVSGRRPVTEQVKAAKDRSQATELLRYLFEDRRGDLTLAVDGLNRRPAAWRKRLRRELAKLPVEIQPVRAFIERHLAAE
jgi:hypothetical protein